MNLIDFVHSINTNDITSAVTKYFEEVMVLYNLFGYHDLDICTDNGSSSATFIVLTESENEAMNIYNRLNDSYYTVYGTKYKVCMRISGCSVKIQMIRVV